MMLFAVDETVTHHVGDQQCPACAEEYPEPCACGGLIHAEPGLLEDPDGNAELATRCDQCRRTADDLEEAGEGPGLTP